MVSESNNIPGNVDACWAEEDRLSAEVWERWTKVTDPETEPIACW